MTPSLCPPSRDVQFVAARRISAKSDGEAFPPESLASVISPSRCFLPGPSQIWPSCTLHGRGRIPVCPGPAPAQIRTGGITASGSYPGEDVRIVTQAKDTGREVELPRRSSPSIGAFHRRGRRPGCPGPPAQIRTGGTTAYGSYPGEDARIASRAKDAGRDVEPG